jgi:4-amino-4-deoxy-L-arabinose transferase-like glycosyltransferase
MRMSSHPSLETRPSAPVGLWWEQLEDFTRSCLARGVLTSGLKGPVLAALFVLIGALPALIALPPLDRDESRFAEASAQMLETGDVVNIRYQAEARNKKPVGIHWLQAASVKLLSSVEKRDIWAYRIPSLLGAMLAAAACAWGATAFFGPRAGALAGAVLGASFILSSEAFIAKTDAALCGAVTLAMAALARLYGSTRGEIQAGRREKVLFWIGLSLSILIKGPVGPGVVGLAILALCIADRRIRWLKTLGWGWGLVIVLLMLGPWFAAITISTDGAFWAKAVAGDIAPKIEGVQETHGAPPGFYLALAPLMLFPAGFLLPAALAAGWRKRALSGVRFALAWLIPMWLVFEILPTKLVHYTLPLYGALAWLIAAALKTPAMAIGPVTRMTGVAFSVLAGVTFAVLTALAASAYAEGWPAFVWAAVVAILALATGAAGAWALLRWRPRRGFLLALVLGVLTHAALSAGLLPRFSALWASDRIADRLAKDGLDPRNGVTTGPVAVVGYAEPSLVFALGTGTELDSPQDGADSVSDGQPAIVEGRADRAFRAALAAQKVRAMPVETVRGFDYSMGRPVALTLWKSLAPPPQEEGDGAPAPASSRP